MQLRGFRALVVELPADATGNIIQFDVPSNAAGGFIVFVVGRFVIGQVIDGARNERRFQNRIQLVLGELGAHRINDM